MIDMRKIIVVGNGPSILTANAGEYIDAHRQVYRINEYYCTDAKTTGFKITTWATCKDFYRSDIYKTATDRFSVDWGQCGSVLFTNKPGTARNQLVIDRAYLNDANFSIIPTEIRDFIAEKYRAYIISDKAKHAKEGPSTGLKVLAYLTEYLGHEVDAVGFDGLQFDEKMHYFDTEIKTYRHNHMHWPEREMACLNEWRENGKVNFYNPNNPNTDNQEEN